MTDSLLWSTAGQSAAWRGLDAPLRVLKAWIDVRLIGDADWIVGAQGRRDAAIPAAKLADTIRKLPPERGNLLSIQMGGTSPRDWTLTGMLLPFGTSFFNLRTSYAQLPPATELARAFVDAFAATDADASFIHAEPQWSRLIAGPYKPALVPPTLAGAFWCTHLGPGALKAFSQPALRAIRAYRAAWSDEHGVSVIAAPTLDATLTPAGEAALQRLTGELRAAKLPIASK